MKKKIIINAGNTNINIALFDGDSIVKTGMLDESMLKYSRENGFCDLFIASVNSKNTKKTVKAFKDFASITEIEKTECFQTEYDLKNLGVDRFINIYYSLLLDCYPSIIIDCGTADTIDYIDSFKKHIGGFITCGLTLLSNSLYNSTERLMKVEGEFGEELIGKNTENAIKYGIYTQWLSGIISFVNLGKKFLNNPEIIITGGNASCLNDFIDKKRIDPLFTLKGIKEYVERIHNT